VGGDLVVYFDPNDIFGTTEVIVRAIFDKEFLERLTRRIEEEFAPRTWVNVADNLLQMVDECVSALPSQTADRSAAQKVRIPIDAGKLYPISGDALVGRSDLVWSQKLTKLVRYSGWHPLESWGCWASKPRAQLRLNVGDDHAGQAATVYLELKLPPADLTRLVIISDIWSNSTTISSLGPIPRWVKFTTTVDSNGLLKIFIETRAKEEHLSDRQSNFFVGFSGIGYYLDEDMISRVSVIEHLLLQMMEYKNDNLRSADDRSSLC
jgi:hypothetical protein